MTLKHAAFGFCGLVLCAGTTPAREPSPSVRATDLTSAMWAEFKKGGVEALTIQYRQGDQLPLTVRAQGELIETVPAAMGTLRIKRDFWLRYRAENVTLSLDGVTFKPIARLLKGTLGVAADGGAVDILLNANFRDGPL